MIRWLIYRAGWTVPALIVLAFVGQSVATVYELLGPARLVFYILALTGSLLGAKALVRQAGAMSRPTLFFVSLAWLFVSLGVLLVALLFAGINNVAPEAPDIPGWIVFGLIGSGTVSIFVVGFILEWAGRRGLLSEEVDAGLLLLLFRRRP